MSQFYAPYAEKAANSRGRLFAQPESPTRTAFARDRDRIIHSTAFRRLKGKTQVFVATSSDYFRTRLTHSLEVAQIARSLAHTLGGDQDLTETIALAHDLGHPPFGHAGEDELQRLSAPWGGFDHNVQTFRVVTRLEHRYPAFEGLNLSWETLEGIIKHNGPVETYLDRPSWKAIKTFTETWDLRCETYASLEAQIAAVSDDIAYNTHDIDDGVRSGLIDIEDLFEVALIAPRLKSVQKDWPKIDKRMLRIEAVRRLIGSMVADVHDEAQRRVKTDGVKTPEDIRLNDRQIIAFSDDMLSELTKLRAFLHERLYQHPSVNRSRSNAKRTLVKLFELYCAEPEILPENWYVEYKSKDSEAGQVRVICDYIGGMTDFYAVEQFRAFFNF
jgi:dGTPase